MCKGDMISTVITGNLARSYTEGVWEVKTNSTLCPLTDGVVVARAGFTKSRTVQGAAIVPLL